MTKAYEYVCGSAKHVIVAAIAVLLTATAVLAEVPDSISLKPREKYAVEFKDAVRSADSDSACVVLRGIGERRLIITAQGKGRGTVSYELRSGATGSISVDVLSADRPDLDARLKYIQDSLADIVGVDASLNSDLGLITVAGVVVTVEDRTQLLKALESVEQRWPGLVDNQVRAKLNTKRMTEALSSLLTDLEISNASVSIAADLSRISLYGEALTKNRKDQAEQAVKRLSDRIGFDDVVLVNAITVSDDLFNIEVTYFQYTDSLTKDVGADLLNNIGFNLGGKGEWEDGKIPKYTASLEINLDKVLNFLMDEGYVSQIKRQTVTTRNGKPGEVQFGSTVIVPIESSVGGASAETVETGDIVKVTPSFVSADRVTMSFHGEVSAVSTIARSGLVSISKNAVAVEVESPLNASVVLGTSFSKGSVSSRGGTPFLRRIPIVNLLFGRKAKHGAESYAGFMVTPRLQKSKATSSGSSADRTDQIIARIERQLTTK